MQQVPALQSFEEKGRQLHLGIPGTMQRINAALAIQLCKTWMGKKGCTSTGNTKLHVSK